MIREKPTSKRGVAERRSGTDTTAAPSKPTIRDVALHAGVAVGTVSRVLNANGSVNALTRRKVQQAIADLGYVPNAVAQSMRSRWTRTIGCVIRDITIPQLAGFVRAAHDALDEQGFSLLVSNSDGRTDRERELLTTLSRRQVDGIMIGPYSPPSAEFDDFLRSLGVPLVLIDRDEPEWADAVVADHAVGIRTAVDQLLQLGHRRIALITGKMPLYPSRERLKGFHEAFVARGLVADERLVHTSSFLADAALRFASSLIGQSQRPTAIVCGGIDMLPGVLRAVRTRGFRVPEDISIIAAGDSDLAQLYTPPISVVEWDQAEFGRIAAGMLLDRIRSGGKAEAQSVLLPNSFILRQSVGPAPSAP